MRIPGRAPPSPHVLHQTLLLLSLRNVWVGVQVGNHEITRGTVPTGLSRRACFTNRWEFPSLSNGEK